MSRTVEKTVQNVLQLSPFNFDVSIQEVLFALSTGRKLFIVPEYVKKDITKLCRFVYDNKINLAIFTPSYFSEFVNCITNESNLSYPDLFVIYLSGEKLILSKNIEGFIARNPHIKIYNQYGPTETHVASEYLLKTDTANVPIGKAITNTQLFVTNQRMEILPFGVAGELCVGGAGVAKGYIDIKQNGKKFSPTPFCKNVLYKTGDWVRLLPGGNILYLGRKDRQIKLRGYRIELSEIEMILAKYPCVLQCAVLITHNHTIAAFYVHKKGSQVDTKKLREFLLSYLPSYMVPSLYLPIDQIPLIQNKKIDYQKLNTIFDISECKPNIEADFYHETISKIWFSILGISSGMCDDFFDLGGHSLTAVRVIHAVNKMFNIKASVADLFQRSQLNDFANFIKKLHLGEKDHDLPEITRIARDKPLPLSITQRRIWFAEYNTNNEPAYNLPVVFNVHGKINIGHLEGIITKLVEQHDILKAKFIVDLNEEPKQVIPGFIDQFKIIQYECEEGELNSKIDQVIHQKFDFSKESLLKIFLVNTKNQSALIILFHHIISDGCTVELFLAEIEKRYNFYGHGLNSVNKFDYIDYISHKENLLKNKHSENKKQYWINKFTSLCPLRLNINLLDITPKKDRYEIFQHTLSIKSPLKLQNLPEHPFATLLAAFAISAWRITDQNHFNVLTVVDERLFVAESNILGPLFNLVLLELKINPQENVAQLIKDLHNEVDIVVEYDSGQYDKLFIDALVKAFCKIMVDITQNSNAKLSDLQLLDTTDNKKLLIEYNKTNTDYPNHISIYELFEEHSEKNTIAIQFFNETLSYSQLYERTNIIAGNLSTLLIKDKSVVAVFLNRKPDTIAVILALIKLGICYFPIDTRLPNLKIKDMLEEVAPAMIVTDSTQYEQLLQLTSKTILFNLDTNLDANNYIPVKNNYDNRITILSTSGSSGKPKYVQIQNKSIARLVRNTNYLLINSQDVIAHIASYAFDVSLIEIWSALANGATLLIVPSEYLLDCDKLDDYLTIHKVTVLFLPSKLFSAYVGQKPSLFAKLKCLFIGGDKPDTTCLKIARDINRTLRMVNLYGPTENTTNTTYFNVPENISPSNPVPIGKPISNTQVYVLNDAMVPLPIGIPGELYIAGEGLSLGYWNNPSDTKEKFVNLNIPSLKKHKKSFKSGDIVRWLPDGNLQFLGRRDRQIKVNDIRLDLNEIESHTMKIKNVKACFAYYIKTRGLVLYYIGKVEQEYLKNCLLQVLPPYHLPNFIFSIDQFPLNINGKIDSDVLKSKYLTNNIHASFDKSILSTIAEIWSRVLDHRDFCHDTPFFEAGGDSLKLMKLCAMLEKNFHIKIIPTILFNLPTIRNIAHFIQDNARSNPVNHCNGNHVQKENKIAIIAMNVRVPGANNLSTFWEKIRDGRELIYDSHFINAHNIIFGILSDYDYFSSEYFGISEQEAELLDPQHRILLEMSANLLYESGYKQSEYPGKIGILASCGFNYYLPSNIFKNFSHFSDHEKTIAILANEKDFIATRIAYKLGLKGPAICINTACSSSLVSVIKGCQSLISGESDMVIAGGISLVYPDAMEFMPHENALYSRTNHFRPFSSDSDGIIRSSGAGLVLLKRLDDAISDRDKVIAIISGYSVNNDGNNKQSFYAPGIDTQAENIQSAINKAGIKPQDILYFETHGTATSLGDAAEIAAMNKVFNKNLDGSVILGSIKANLGHTDAASGVIGLIKVALMLKNAELTPQINFSQLNPVLSDEFKPFHIADKSHSLDKDMLSKYFGVSSLGIGGTNAHILLTACSQDCMDTKNADLKLPELNYTRKRYWLNKNYSINLNRPVVRNIVTELNFLWSDVIGISDINIDDNFIDLGGDSLSAINLCTRINEKFGINLSYTDILQFDTIAKQNEFISKRREAISHDFVIKLNNQTEGTPLILIHPIGGGVFCYAKFAKQLEKYMPVYGIQNSILTPAGKSFLNLPDLADFYNKQIQKILGQQEFTLGGWSFGGNVAYEMACQLVDKYANCKIFFFDSWNFYQLNFPYDEHMRKSIHTYIPEVVDLAAGYDMRHKENFYDLLHERMQLILNYKYSTPNIPVVLFKATHILPQFQIIDNLKNHWGNLLSDENLSIVQINATHDNLFHTNVVNNLVNQFLKYNI